MQILRNLLPTIETPVLTIDGARDAVVPPANAEYLRARLLNNKLDIVEGGHFMWEDVAETYATLVRTDELAIDHLKHPSAEIR